MALVKKKESNTQESAASFAGATSNARKKNRKKADSILDLDEIKLRTARADKPGSEVVEVDLPAPVSEMSEPPLLFDAVSKAASEAGLKKGTSVAIDLPRSAVVLRQITVPLVADQNEINSMVYFQVSRDLPFKAEEAVVDYQIQREIAALEIDTPKPADAKEKEKPADPAPDSRRLEVLVAAVKSDVLQRYQATAEAAGLKVVQVGLRSLSNLRAVAETHKTSDAEAICLVSMRWDEIIIEVGAGGVLAVSRVVLTAPDVFRRLRPKETPTADPCQEIITLITTEVIRTFHAFDGMGWHKPIKEVLIVGELGCEQPLLEKLKSRLSVPCSLLPAETAKKFWSTGLQLLTQEGGDLDFLEPKKPRVVVDRKRIKMLAAVAAGIVLLIVLFGVRTNLINKRLKVKLAVQNELAEAEKKQPIYRKMRQQVVSIRSWAKTGPTWLDHYAYLTSILPPATDLYVTSITSSSAGTLRLAVQARTGEILAEMEKKIRAAGYSVKPISITPGSDKYGYNFRTTVELIIPAKFKQIELDKLKAPQRPEDDMPPATADATPRKNTVATARP